MQREIKFRALLNVDCSEGSGLIKMVYFGLPEMDNGLWSFPIDKNISHINEYISPLMQYTGLQDKNGREVYEGDLVKCFYGGMEIGNVDTVVFKNAAFYLRNRNISIDTFLQDDGIYSTAIEVIGNIYENTELLNQTTT